MFKKNCNLIAKSTAKSISRIRQLGVSINFEKLLESSYKVFLAKNMVVIDIGANSGQHTEIFLNIVGDEGSVSVFEPIPDMVAILKSKFGERIHIFETALSNENFGKQIFKYATKAVTYSGLKQRIYDTDDPGVIDIEVEVRTLDDFIDRFDKVDFIKIDIEGGELDCLQGGINLINKFRPYLSVEYGQKSYKAYGKKDVDLFNWCKANKYFLCDLFGNAITDKGTWLEICNSAYWDYLLVPKEKYNNFCIKMNIENQNKII